MTGADRRQYASTPHTSRPLDLEAVVISVDPSVRSFPHLLNMSRRVTRYDVLERLRKTVDSGKILVGAGAGLSSGPMRKSLADSWGLLILWHRHWSIREVSRGWRSRSHSRVQFGPLPYGWKGIPCRHDAVFRRERSRRGYGTSFTGPASFKFPFLVPEHDMTLLL